MNKKLNYSWYRTTGNSRKLEQQLTYKLQGNEQETELQENERKTAAVNDMYTLQENSWEIVGIKE
jgi:hypothetical protein